MRRGTKVLLAAAVVSVAAVGIYATTSGGGSRVDGFDSAKWQAARGVEPEKNRRSGMLKSLDDAVRPGMSRAEVIALLGPADREQPGKLIYDLGISFPSIDYQYYVFEFDSNDSLTQHFMTRS